MAPRAKLAVDAAMVLLDADFAALLAALGNHDIPVDFLTRVSPPAQAGDYTGLTLFRDDEPVRVLVFRTPDFYDALAEVVAAAMPGAGGGVLN